MLELHHPQDSKTTSNRKFTSYLPIEQPVGFLDAWFAQSHRQVLVAAAEFQAAVVELVAAGRRFEAVANEKKDCNSYFSKKKNHHDMSDIGLTFNFENLRCMDVRMHRRNSRCTLRHKSISITKHPVDYVRLELFKVRSKHPFTKLISTYLRFYSYFLRFNWIQL